MLDHPLVTIGITCYNAEDTIQRAVQSAVNQDWKQKEIIIVDDCSTDGSKSIIKQMAADNKSIRLIMHDNNTGVAGARQSILNHAKGEFIAFFDDDDESLPERISTQVKRINEYEADNGCIPIACYASGYRQYANGYQLPLNAIGSQDTIPYGEDVAAYLLYFKKNDGWFYGSGTPTCSLMLRTRTLKLAGGFSGDLRRLEDVDLSIRLALQGAHFIGCPQTLFIQHSTSASDKAPEANFEAEQALAQKHSEFLKSKGYFTYALKWPELRYFHYKKRYLKMLMVFISLFVSYPVKSTKHLFYSGPKRLLHEFKMSR